MGDVGLMIIYGIISLLYIFMIPKAKEEEGNKLAKIVVRVAPYIWIGATAVRLMELSLKLFSN